MNLFKRVKQILHLLPPPLAKSVETVVEFRKETRVVEGKVVDASYDAETGRIIIWGDLKVDDLDLVIILMHEVGHLIFHQVLSDKGRKEWRKIYSKETLDFGLEEDYPTHQVPEEAFCCIGSILGTIYWLESLGMKNKAKKVREKLEKLSHQGERFVAKAFRIKKKELYHSTVERIRRWVEEETGFIK